MGLEALSPIIKYLPEVRKPERALLLNEKLLWTGIALLLFFVMYHVYPLGVDTSKLQSDVRLEVLLASKLGSLVSVGISPIILASIFLQLLIGSKIIQLDLSNPANKRLFQGTQKMLAILLSFFESAVYVFTGYVPATAPGLMLFVILQLALGSLILLFLDEIVSKYGIGSGISLFIAAGVSLTVVNGVISLIIPNAANGFGTGGIPAALLAFLPLVFTILVFVTVVYAEGMRVEIPLSFGRARGIGGRYPIKFLYVSNIPVILASALILNLQLWTKILNDNGILLLGVMQGGQLTDGFAYFVSPTFPSPLFVGYDAYLSFLGTPREIFHIFTYVAFTLLLCVLFGKFWIETTGLGTKDVAAQLERVGFQIPGFRRDPRVIEKVLEKYIPMITILGSLFVGALASFADLTGALGTGTGILLTVTILHNFYESLASQRMFEVYPALKKFMG